MDILVNTTLPAHIVIGADGQTAIAQEVRTLLATPKGSVALDRNFGVSWDALDHSMPGAKQVIIAEIASQIEKYVPRVRFKSIDFINPGASVAADGVLPVTVTVEIREEYLDELRQS